MKRWGAEAKAKKGLTDNCIALENRRKCMGVRLLGNQNFNMSTHAKKKGEEISVRCFERLAYI